MASPPALLLALLEAEQTADPPDAAGGAPPPDGMVWVKTKNDAGIVTVQCTTYCVASFWFFISCLCVFRATIYSTITPERRLSPWLLFRPF